MSATEKVAEFGLFGNVAYNFLLRAIKENRKMAQDMHQERMVLYFQKAWSIAIKMQLTID